MGRRKWRTAPLELIFLDFLVNLLRTTKGNMHLLAINDHFYGMRLSNIFEIPSISNENPSISIEIPSYSIKNLLVF